MKTAQKNADAADQALSDAKTGLDKANADVAAKTKALSQAQSQYDEAKKASDDKTAAYNKAQSDLDAMQSGSSVKAAQDALDKAKSAQEKAQNTYDSAKTKANAAQDKLNAAQSAKDTAAAKATEAQKAAKDAKANVDKAKETLSKATEAFNNSGKAFIESMLTNNQTFDSYVNQLKNIDVNCQTINIPVKDVVNNEHFNDALKQALTVEALKKDMELIKENNQLRQKNGVNDLVVSYSSMEEAAVSAAMASVCSEVYRLPGHAYPSIYIWNNRSDFADKDSALSCTFGENASFGYTDPFIGWYNEEQQFANLEGGMRADRKGYPTEQKMTKEECIAFLKKDENYQKLGLQLNDIDNFVNQYYGKLDSNNAFVTACDDYHGHYNNLLDSAFTKTGLAYINDYDVGYDPMNGYGNTCVQRFTGANLSQDNKNNSITDTPDEFINKLNKFTKKVQQDLDNANKALSDAQAAQKKADAAVTTAQNGVKTADTAYNTAKGNAEKANTELSDAQTALDQAKNETSTKQKDYDAAVNADKDKAEAIKQQQAKVDAAKAAKTQADQQLKTAEAAKQSAEKALSSAQKTQTDAQTTVDQAQAQVNNQKKALSAAEQALTDAQKAQDSAQKDADSAAKNETAAIEAFKNADGLEKQAYDAYQKSGKNLVDFVNKHIEALPDDNQLTLDDQDDVDTMSKIVDAVPAELKAGLKQDNLKKMDASKQKIAELTLIQKDKDAAKAVADKTEELPEEITADNAAAVYDVQEAYNNLTDRQKDFVGQEAKDKIAAAVKAADKATADAVNGQIAALPDTITLSDKAAVQAARAAYNKLSDAAKAQVDTTRLTAAEKAIQSLEKQNADNDAAQKVDTMINALPKHPSAKDRAGILNVYRRYQALSASARAMLPDGDVARLLAAMKAANAANPAGTNGNAAVVTAKTANSTAAGSPKTGDNTAAGAEAAAILAAIAGLGFARRRRRESEEDA